MGVANAQSNKNDGPCFRRRRADKWLHLYCLNLFYTEGELDPESSIFRLDRAASFPQSKSHFSVEKVAFSFPRAFSNCSQLFAGFRRKVHTQPHTDQRPKPHSQPARSDAFDDARTVSLMFRCSPRLRATQTKAGAISLSQFETARRATTCEDDVRCALPQTGAAAAPRTTFRASVADAFYERCGSPASILSTANSYS